VRLLLLRALLGWLAAYHLTVGLVSVAWPAGARRIAARAYGLAVETSPQMSFLLKPLGTYAITVGCLLVAACRAPDEHRAIVNATVLLLLMRAATRLLCADELEHAFQVPASQNLFNVGLLVIQAAGLLLLKR
jgi:hypothetical protein